MKCRDVDVIVISPSIHYVAKSRYYQGNPVPFKVYTVTFRHLFLHTDGSCCLLIMSAMELAYDRIMENILK